MLTAGLRWCANLVSRVKGKCITLLLSMLYEYHIILLPELALQVDVGYKLFAESVRLSWFGDSKIYS